MDKKVILALFVFLLGWFSSSIYFDSYNTKIYGSIEKINTKNLMEPQELEKLESKSIKDKPSPNNWINKDRIFVYGDEVVIKVKNPQWAIFTDTKSMDPVIDSTSKAIEIQPKSEEEIKVGDIVAYKSDYKWGIVTHRVIDIGYDANGWYARLKGDNNDYMDPEKVRFEQIKGVVVAVIY